MPPEERLTMPGSPTVSASTSRTARDDADAARQSDEALAEAYATELATLDPDQPASRARIDAIIMDLGRSANVSTLVALHLGNAVSKGVEVDQRVLVLAQRAAEQAQRVSEQAPERASAREEAQGANRGDDLPGVKAVKSMPEDMPLVVDAGGWPPKTPIDQVTLPDDKIREAIASLNIGGASYASRGEAPGVAIVPGGKAPELDKGIV